MLGYSRAVSKGVSLSDDFIFLVAVPFHFPFPPWLSPQIRLFFFFVLFIFLGLMVMTVMMTLKMFVFVTALVCYCFWVLYRKHNTTQHNNGNYKHIIPLYISFFRNVTNTTILLLLFVCFAVYLSNQKSFKATWFYYFNVCLGSSLFI